MTYGGQNCHGLTKVKVPAVLLLEMTSAKIQVLLRVKGNPNILVVRYMNDQNKIQMFMLEFLVRSISPLHSKDFQLLWSSYKSLHKLRTPYAFPLSINLSLMKYLRKNTHIGRRNIEFTYSQVTTSECILSKEYL